MEKDKRPLNQYLKELRKSCGYSQEFVASHLNITRQTYSHYETVFPLRSIRFITLQGFMVFRPKNFWSWLSPTISVWILPHSLRFPTVLFPKIFQAFLIISMHRKISGNSNPLTVRNG